MKHTIIIINKLIIFSFIILMSAFSSGCNTLQDYGMQKLDDSRQNVAFKLARIQGRRLPNDEDYAAVDKAAGVDDWSKLDDDSAVLYDTVNAELDKRLNAKGVFLPNQSDDPEYYLNTEPEPGGIRASQSQPSSATASTAAASSAASSAAPAKGLNITINDLVGTWYLDNNPYPNGRYYMSFHSPTDNTISFTATQPLTHSDGSREIASSLYNYTATYTVDASSDTIHLHFKMKGTVTADMEINFSDKTHIKSSKWYIYQGTYTKE
ncbi:MAG: hypothetical protein IK152_06165 [Lachnospiraceae bacterium]|nr:hypothetical protein [Lachnospiraceae bacterium]